ncbi:DUF3556 domain-containing protein [Streptomyces sp. NBC_01474]|uniref:DUF3556 domain-containing protein n=1 Tax=Streptomyces sp. NBC_01474 TaxID=2903880 RepID=UPI002DDAB233|nr:DUF3556 domain-containing protein [Streptomyces sp. NBC_01474]
MFTLGVESRLDAVQRPTRNQKDPLLKLGYTENAVEITLQQTIAWRSMHSQGRGLFSVPPRPAGTGRSGRLCICRSPPSRRARACPR